MDLPEPTGAAALLDAMAAAQEHFDTDAERRLLDALAAAELLVPLVTDPDSGTTVAARLGGEDGTQALVAFTHAAAAESFGSADGLQIGVMPAPALAATAVGADAGLVLNPAGPHAGQLDRRALDSLAAVAATRPPAAPAGPAAPTGPAATAGDELAGGAGAEADPEGGFELRPPAAALDAELVEALRAAVTQAPTLREAWHADVTGAGPDHGLLVLVGDGEDPPPSITDLLAEHLPDGESMDLLPVDASAWDRGDFAQVSDVAQLV